VNRLRLRAQLTGRAALRYTPAGLPALDLEMHHVSTVVEAGVERTLDFPFEAVALGETAARLEKVAPGTGLEIEGFLAPRGKRSNRLRVHVTQFVPSAPPADDKTS
jgi:primosomal replication protein N